MFVPVSGLSHKQRESSTVVCVAAIEACELCRITSLTSKSLSSNSRTNLRVWTRPETTFQRFFFQQTQIPTDLPPSEPISVSEYASRVVAFVATLVENFFLPCKPAGHFCSLIRTDMLPSETFDQEISSNLPYRPFRSADCATTHWDFAMASQLENTFSHT